MPRIQWHQDTIGRRRLFHWGCVIAASRIRSSCFSVQGLCHFLPTEQFWGWAGLVKCGFSLCVLLVPDPCLSKGSHRLWALHWAPEEEQPWGSQKVARTGILNTEPGSLPAIGCWGLALNVALLGLPSPSWDPELWVASVALLLPHPPALGEKAHREITAGLTRSKYYADFSLGTLPGVQQEGIMHGVFWLWIKKITEKLTAWWLSQDLEGSGWDMLEKNSLCCLGSFNDFHVPLTSLCAQVLEGKSGETGWIDANSTCVHEDILICQSLLEHWGKICMIFRGKLMYYHFSSNFVDPF